MSVIHMDNLRPKQLNKRYKGCSYTITYLVGDKQWKWEVTIVQTTHFDGTSKTINAAQKAAEKFIDDTLTLQGRGHGIG